MQLEVLEEQTRSLGPGHPDTVINHGNVVNSLVDLGRGDEAGDEGGVSR